MKLYYDAAYGLLFICASLGIGYFDADACNAFSKFLLASFFLSIILIPFLSVIS